MDHEDLIKLLNQDLEMEFQSIVQYVQHVATISGAEYASTVDELKIHLTQELATRPRWPSRSASSAANRAPRCRTSRPPPDSRGALEADLALETQQLEHYRERVQQANEAGLADVAEALRPLLTETQEHVRDLSTALGL